MSSPPTWFFTGNTYARTRKCDWLWCLNVALPLAGVVGRQQISDTLGGDFCEWEHLKVCEDAANKQFQSQNILVKRSLVWRRESPRHSLWSFDHYSQFLFTQQKYDIKCRSHVDCVKMALLKRLPVVCRHSMRKKKRASERLNHISSVPWEELSACHQPQSHYQQSALHRRGRTAQPSLPFFSFHLLLPFSVLFPSVAHRSWHFSFSVRTLKKTLARNTDMWNFSGSPVSRSEVRDWMDGWVGRGESVNGWCPFSSIVLFASLWPRELKSRWKKCSPRVQIWALSPPTLPLTHSCSTSAQLDSKIWTGGALL